ncbi:MAG TPA: maltose alpha-D-glucosyltransferase [Stellaceae bacterium]|nr:maltose alpha-D-glucosyltransferase [Stellaceae bacterium]
MPRNSRSISFDRSDPVWFKNAVIYQLHVKAFFDANDDGIGDLRGLTRKLDYLQDLGVTALWLLPFYPSPLRDDGYDIACYDNVHPSYGTLKDFREFVRECHRRNLRVITELVVNHTSDQHPWFQRARKAKPGSAFRDYYVWSDTDQRYKDTRVIFVDTEKSNWTWDETAGAYYWHRFYSHQPDLNFDKPRVLKEVINVLRFWLEMGVDGLRLDAVPYLVEREGTSNENLPETHDVLKQIRAEIDAKFPDRMMLAEANQWPEDVLSYFGAGDECHMAFHFPLMPRMYMAIAQEDRHPITDIMRQTPSIPDRCQWAIFLRNHDELTLEMVTDRERDYLWTYYAADRRARINLGIRRRLAPLMENDRRKIELMYGLLLSLPGTPVLYYGDEIGMGDNIYLGDRNGVRTPMQWSPDRNAGFSRAAPESLYLPPIMDPIYGYEAVNVEAQARNSSSLLSWTKRALTIRQTQRAFGLGTLQFLYPGNRKILAYLREHEGTTILCVFNLARSPQAVELDLSRYKGRVPVELGGRSLFPPVGELNYLLTLPGYGFYWFILAEQASLPSWHEPLPEPLPDLLTLVVRGGLEELLVKPAREQLEADALPAFLAKQRWFGAKDARITKSALSFGVPLRVGGISYLFSAVDVELSLGSEQRYFLPLAVSSDKETETPGWPLLPFTIARVRRGRVLGALYDASATESFPLTLVDAIRQNLEIKANSDAIVCRATPQMAELQLPASAEVRRLKVEQSNSSIQIGDQLIAKLYRRITRGVHPEIEMARFLTQVGFANTPPLYGTIEHVDENGVPTALVVVQGFVRNQGDGWSNISGYVVRRLEEQQVGTAQTEPRADSNLPHAYQRELAVTLGRRTAELHRALATPVQDADFAPEPISAKDIAAWRAAALEQVEASFATLKRQIPALPEADRPAAGALLARRRECVDCIKTLARDPIKALKTRIHGDYHLGQVLVAQRDWYIIDFEGEPAKALAQRRAKQSPLRDLAGMLRSFDYAAWSAVRHVVATTGTAADATVQQALAWRDETFDAFMEGYRALKAEIPSYPADEREAARLLQLFTLEKACYELAYEAANRPDWIAIPIRGIASILDASTAKQK